MEGTIPRGYCQCGCGQKTNIAKQTVTKLGWVKGQPLKYIRGHAARKPGVEYTIEDRGHETPCWIWQRYRTQNGYGWKRVSGRSGYAHRIYYERVYGPVEPGSELDHLCRVRECVNPDHLEPVTHRVNIRRGTRGKLTAEQVSEIKALLSEGLLSQTAIGNLFGVSSVMISRIHRGLAWEDIS